MHSLNCVCEISTSIVTRDIEGDIIIVPLTSAIGDADDELYSLNETGKAIWQRLDGHRTIREIAAELALEFSSPDNSISSDVLGFVEEMVQRRLLVVVGEESTANVR